MTNIELILLANSIHCFIWFGLWSSKSSFQIIMKVSFLLFAIANLLLAIGKLPI